MKFVPRFGSLKISTAAPVVFAIMLFVVACGGGDNDEPASRNDGPTILADGSLVCAATISGMGVTQ